MKWEHPVCAYLAGPGRQLLGLAGDFVLVEHTDVILIADVAVVHWVLPDHFVLPR